VFGGTCCGECAESYKTDSEAIQQRLLGILVRVYREN
jgi:hypothetical protein